MPFKTYFRDQGYNKHSNIQQMRTAAVILFALLFCNQVSAQNARERIRNNVQVSQSKNDLERDIKELAAYKMKVAAYEAAVDSSDTELALQLKAGIISDLDRELDQAALLINFYIREGFLLIQIIIST